MVRLPPTTVPDYWQINIVGLKVRIFANDVVLEMSPGYVILKADPPLRAALAANAP